MNRYNLVSNRRTGRYLLTTRILAVSALFQRGKTCVPVEVRQILDVGDGDKLTWIVDAGRIYVESAEKTK